MINQACTHAVREGDRGREGQRERERQKGDSRSALSAPCLEPPLLQLWALSSHYRRLFRRRESSAPQVASVDPFLTRRTGRRDPANFQGEDGQKRPELSFFPVGMCVRSLSSDSPFGQPGCLVSRNFSFFSSHLSCLPLPLLSCLAPLIRGLSSWHQGRVPFGIL